MELYELQRQIMEKKLRGAYIFAGIEGAVQHVYIEQMAKAAGCTEIVRPDTVAEAINAMTKRTLSPSKRLYVVFDDISFTKAEKAWMTAFSRADSSQHLLVIQYSKLDKRFKFAKQQKERICTFDRLGDDVAMKYVQKQFEQYGGVHEDVAAMMAEACNNDYGRILSECDKVTQLYQAWSVSAEESGADWSIDDAALTLLEQGVIYKPIGDITFKLTDAILYRNPPEVQEYLEQAQLKKEPELMIVSILYNSFKHILMVQALPDGGNAVQKTGLTPFQVKLAKEKLNYYSISELVRNMKLLQGVEYGIKTGTFEAATALDYVAVACMA